MLSLHNLRKVHILMEQEAVLTNPLGNLAAAMAKRNTFQILAKKLNLVSLHLPNLSNDIFCKYVYLLDVHFSLFPFLKK